MAPLAPNRDACNASTCTHADVTADDSEREVCDERQPKPVTLGIVAGMTLEDVVEVLTALDAGGVDYWVGGGWAIDALLGRQTREHRDLDLGVRLDDVQRIESLLPQFRRESAERFAAEVGCDPQAFSDAWRRHEIEDTPESADRAIEAFALATALDRVGKADAVFA